MFVDESSRNECSTSRRDHLFVCADQSACIRYLLCLASRVAHHSDNVRCTCETHVVDRPDCLGHDLVKQHIQCMFQGVWLVGGSECFRILLSHAR